MASITDFRPRGSGQRWAVRLLFLFVVVEFFAGMVIRKKMGEPYPGLFMPAFAGYGLDKMTAETGELTVCRITISFADETSQEMSLIKFCGRTMPSMLLPVRIFAAPESKSAVTPELQNFLRGRVAELVPNKNAMGITFRIYRETFRLDDPQASKRLDLLEERTVGL